MVESLILSRREEGDYKFFLESCQESSIYHLLEWRDIISAAYGFIPKYIIARKLGKIQGILPLFEVKTPIRGTRIISLPFSHLVPVLSRSKEAFDVLLHEAERMIQDNRAKYGELRHGSPIHFNSCFHNSAHNIESLLDLRQPLAEIWNKFDNSVKRGIRKAEKSGLVIDYGSDLEEFRIFYELLTETRRSQGTPVYPFSFFHLIFEKLSKANICKLGIVYFENIPVAGAIIFEWNKKVLYAYGASSREQRYRQLRPNNLLFWELIQWSHSRGNHVFDFGSSPKSNIGLLQFKKRWGAIHSPLYYCFISKQTAFPALNRESPGIRAIQALIRNLPPSIFKLVSSILLKESC